MERVNLDTLAGANYMLGKDTIKGFDVLVSYSEDIVNKLLAERSATIGLLAPVTLETEYFDPVQEETYPLTFTLNISDPCLQFVDSVGSVQLILRFTGTYTLGSNKPHPFPEHLQIVITTNLVNVSGIADAGVFVPSPTSPLKPGNWISLIDNKTAQASQAVCLNLTKIEAKIDNAPSGATDIGKLAAYNDMFSRRLATYITQTAGLHFYIGGISNLVAEERDVTTLRPKSFCFSVIPAYPDKQEPAVLCTWIGLEGGSANLPGPTLLVFDPNGKPVNPLPQGKSASVIFSHNTLANLFLKPELSKSLNSVSCTSGPGTAGMVFNCNLPSLTIDIPAYNYKTSFVEKRLHSFSGSTDTPTAAIKFSSDVVTSDKSPVSFNWTGDTKHLEWSSTTHSRNGPNSTYGAVDAHFSYSGSAVWKGDKEKDRLELIFSTDKSLTSHFDAKDPGGLFGQNELPSQWESSALPKFNIDLPLKLNTLDYLLTTNLLFPGKHVFIPDDPVGSLALPRDLIITGQIVHSIKALQRTVILYQVPSSPLERFKADVYSHKRSKFFCTLLQTIGKADPAALSEQVSSVMHRFGYEGLTMNDITTQLGLSEAFFRSGDTTPADPALLDLRAFGGYYVCQSPQNYAGKVLFIHPVTGHIRLDGVEAVPSQSVDVNKTPINEFTFNVRDRFFKISLGAHEEPELNITTSLSGFVGEASGQSAPFYAKLKEIEVKPELTYEDQDDETALLSLPIRLASLDSAGAIAGLVGLGITIVMIIPTVIACYWRKEDNKKWRDMETRQRDLDRKMEVGLLRQVVKDTASDLPSVDLRPHLEAIANQAITKIHEQLSHNLDLSEVVKKVIQDWDHSDPFSKPEFEPILKEAQKSIRDEIRRLTVETYGPRLQEELDGLVGDGLIGDTTEARENAEKRILEQKARTGSDTVFQIKNGSSYLNLAVTEMLIGLNLEERMRNVDTINKKIQRDGKLIKEKQGEVDSLRNDKLKKAEAVENVANEAGETPEDTERRKEKLEKELSEIAEKLEQKEKELGEKREEDHKKKEEKVEKEKEHKRAEEALKRARERKQERAS